MHRKRKLIERTTFCTHFFLYKLYSHWEINYESNCFGFGSP